MAAFGAPKRVVALGPEPVGIHSLTVSPLGKTARQSYITASTVVLRCI